MAKCKYCGKPINFITSNSGRPVATNPSSVKRFLYEGEIVKGPEVHTCPDYDKQHKKREVRAKYAPQNQKKGV